MPQQTTDLLPFRTDETDIHEGMGTIVTIVDLAEYEGKGRRVLASGRDTIHDGRCYRCDYDRGERRAHTEVEGYVVRCRHCDAKLVEAGPR